MSSRENESHEPGATPRGAMESTIELLELARAGDRAAIDELCTRYIPRLRRWTHGRLPLPARDLLETDDVVQEVLIRTVRRVDRLEPRSIGEFHSYLRRSLTNRIRDEIRRAGREPRRETITDDAAATQLSPIEELLGREEARRYEAALERLKPHEREAIVARVEMGCSYQEIAQTLGKASPDAARMAVTRAIMRLAEEINRGA